VEIEVVGFVAGDHEDFLKLFKATLARALSAEWMTIDASYALPHHLQTANTLSQHEHFVTGHCAAKQKHAYTRHDMTKNTVHKID